MLGWNVSKSRLSPPSCVAQLDAQRAAEAFDEEAFDAQAPALRPEQPGFNHGSQHRFLLAVAPAPTRDHEHVRWTPQAAGMQLLRELAQGAFGRETVQVDLEDVLLGLFGLGIVVSGRFRVAHAGIL